MSVDRFDTSPGRLFDAGLLRPDAARALRCVAAFVVPIVWMQAAGRVAEVVFIAIGAQVIANTDLRGPYRLRLAVLLAMGVIAVGSTFLGGLAGHSLPLAVAGMGLIAGLAGVWRHVSPDYGPALGISSGLLFLMALATPGDVASSWHQARLTLLGAGWGAVLQLLFWPVRPQHPLRQAVAESWIALADLLESMRAALANNRDEQVRAVAAKELGLRGALDRTFETLALATSRRGTPFLAHLENLQLTAAQLGTRLVTLNAALEALMPRGDYARYAATVDSLLAALNNLTRSVALTAVSHRAEHFAATEVRLRRCEHLLQIFGERLEAHAVKGDAEVAQAGAVLPMLRRHLGVIERALRDTVDHTARRGGVSLRLPDLGGVTLRSMTAWLNPAPQLDPVLVRYTARMMVLTMIGVAVYKGFAIPRGYWIAFTMIVVLQPDYGATRKRAGERILGTVAGSLLASAFLWVRIPLPVIDVLVGCTVFGFAYFMKTRYALAVFFVTLQLVLLTETAGRVPIEFTIERVLSNLAGGGLALVAALVFWPSWERLRFPTVMAAALRANLVYLKAVGALLTEGREFDGPAVAAKRAAESANSIAAASLQRMNGDPEHHRRQVDLAAALMNYTQRITRAITALTLEAGPGRALHDRGWLTATQALGEALDQLARRVESGSAFAEKSKAPAAAAGTAAVTLATAREALIAGSPARGAPAVDLQLGKIATEVEAMMLALGRA